jgi:hypothetical protein
MKLKALSNRVLGYNMSKGERKVGSIILTNDNGKLHGIRSRWFQVYDVGSEIKDIVAGQWVLVSHGRWTKGFKMPKVEDPKSDADFETYYQLDYPDGVLAVTDEQPEDNYVNDTTKI